MSTLEKEIKLGVPLSELNADTKCWVYTAEKPFNENQLQTIEALGETFIDQWVSHGKKVKGSIQVIKNQFIAIFADPNGDDMCGRAQDASVNLIKELEAELSLSLMDRMLVAYQGKNGIVTDSFLNIRGKLVENELSDNKLFYNGLIQTKDEFEKDWERPIKGSWLAL